MSPATAEGPAPVMLGHPLAFMVMRPIALGCRRIGPPRLMSGPSGSTSRRCSTTRCSASAAPSSHPASVVGEQRRIAVSVFVWRVPPVPVVDHRPAVGVTDETAIARTIVTRRQSSGRPSSRSGCLVRIRATIAASASRTYPTSGRRAFSNNWCQRSTACLVAERQRACCVWWANRWHRLAGMRMLSSTPPTDTGRVGRQRAIGQRPFTLMPPLPALANRECRSARALTVLFTVNVPPSAEPEVASPAGEVELPPFRLIVSADRFVSTSGDCGERPCRTGVVQTTPAFMVMLLVACPW